jgi:hypothetical protein
MLYNVHTCSSLWGRSFKWNPLNPGPSPTSQPSLCSGNQLSDCWCEIFDTWHTGNRKHKFQAVNLVNFIYSVSTQSLAQFLRDTTETEPTCFNKGKLQDLSKSPVARSAKIFSHLSSDLPDARKTATNRIGPLERDVKDTSPRWKNAQSSLKLPSQIS